MNQINRDQINKIYHQSILKLLTEAAAIHAEYFPKREIQASSLLSIKTGGCPENCSYCPQSAFYKTGVEKTKLLDVHEVLKAASSAKAQGADRFCMGAAWRDVKDGPQFDSVIEMIKGVKSLGLETCCTLGMLNANQSEKLKMAGLDYYNHNIDTSREHYQRIIQTRTYDERLQTIQNVRDSGMNVCTGGILGIGESEEDRISFIEELLRIRPESITINTLVASKGTPLENEKPIHSFELVRVIATLRILNPSSMIRLSAGRLSLSDEAQTLCFLSGANSIFLGDKLLTSPNPEVNRDTTLLQTLGLSLKETQAYERV